MEAILKAKFNRELTIPSSARSRATSTAVQVGKSSFGRSVESKSSHGRLVESKSSHGRSVESKSSLGRSVAGRGHLLVSFGLVQVNKRGGHVPSFDRGSHVLRSKTGSLLRSSERGGHVSTLVKGRAERAMVKSGPVAASAAEAAPGHSEAAAELCQNKQCILNICEVSHVTATAAAAAGTASSLWSRSVAAMELNVQQAVAKSTAKKYDYWWGRFCAFCRRTEVTEMPFSGHTAAVFLSHLAESATGLGGVDGARSALKHNFTRKCPDMKCPTDGAQVILAMKGIKRRFEKPVTKKSPLTIVEFYKLVKVLTDSGNFYKVRLCQLRLAAQVTLMFTAFSRFEESSALMRSQVKLCQGDLIVTFKKGKNFQHGEARRSVIAGQPGSFNPVTVILSYMERLGKVDKSPDGFLFPALRSTSKGDGVLPRPASYNSVMRQFKEAVVAAGVAADPADYGLHSMRRGAVTSAINNGTSDHCVQKQMRVGSGATVRRYATLDIVSLKSASAAIFKKM